MNLFYAAPGDVSGSRLVLRDQEARHAEKVLRHQTGDALDVTDGAGCLYKGVIETVGKNEVHVQVEEKHQTDQPVPYTTLAIGMIKKRERLEFAIEKSVELGVSRLIIFHGDHSEKKGVRMERLEMTALSAIKQSLRLWLPPIHHCNSLDEVIAHFPVNRTILADETVEKSEVRPSDLSNINSLLLLIGPEGGFSERERDMMRDKNILRISLGAHRLRTETAAIAALSSISL